MSQQLAILGGRPVREASFPDWPVSGPQEEAADARVLRSRRWGRFGDGEIERFERRFAELHGARFGLAVTSGTVALRVALMALGIEAGDEVIVPPYTFLATATAVIECNAIPIFVDIERESYNLDPRLLEAAITRRTRAIIPVHFAGLPADMDGITEITARHGIGVVEDAAHAHGGRYHGQPVGALGHVSCFSFQSSKNLNSGEGGALLTNDQRLYDAARSFHNCGRREDGPWYEHHVISGNYRITELQAALLNAQLDRVPEQAHRRQQNGDRLAERVARIPGLRPQRSRSDAQPHAAKAETCAGTEAGDRHTYHLFLFRYDPAVYGVAKDIYVRALQAEGIPLSVGYPVPLHRQPLFQKLMFGPYTEYRRTRPELDYREVRCPVAEYGCAAEAVWLYQSVLLGTERDVDDIAVALEKVYANRAELKNVPPDPVAS